MNKVMIAVAVSFAMTGFAAHAQTVVSDTDGNGVFSIEELTAAYSDMSADLFTQLDVDGSGAIDADELQAGREGGLIGA